MSKYDSQFYANNLDGSTAGARKLLPIIAETFGPKSYLDVGCGTATWLKTARSFGVEEVFGVDGPWAAESLVISQDHFRAIDLNQPFDLGRKFDIAASLEVAEHVQPESADIFVENLTKHADLVLFGAAAPYQGGTGHVNEQWPSYWIEKFASRNFICFDMVRWKLWNDRAVEPWYSQNTFIFINSARPDLLAKAEAVSPRVTAADAVAVIHPQLWTWQVRYPDNRIPDDMRLILTVSRRVVANILRKLRILPQKKPLALGY